MSPVKLSLTGTCQGSVVHPCWAVSVPTDLNVFIALWALLGPFYGVTLTPSVRRNTATVNRTDHSHRLWSGVYMEMSSKDFWNLSKFRRTEEIQDL